ncbi:MAG: glycerol-3-phosphate dehydrogenase/oxidase [Acidimicrobiales bacterium]|jgi:glycerol-3-phosphate dehydrogenase
MLPLALNPERREADLRRLASEDLDVLVVGGGIVGAGTALDAVTRGLSVGIVEAQDWASGTSSKSSKLLHGGLRYLQMMDFVLVQQALRERDLLLRRVAPHLVRKIPFLYPLHHRIWERVYVGAGIALYDVLGWSTGTSRGVPRHRQLSRRRALALAPGLRSESLVGAIEYYDGQVDDARFVVEVVRTAVSFGALGVNRAQVVGFLRDGDATRGAVVRDLETGTDHEVRARTTVLATGAWTEDTETLAGHGRALRVRPSKGIHLVVPRAKIPSSVALVVPTEKSVLFVLPWGEHWLIGTTDTDWKYGKGRPVTTAGDVSYLLHHVNRVLETPLTPDDVEAVFAGLRPLIAGVGVVRGPGEAGAKRFRPKKARATATTKLSREHAIGRPAAGLVVVSGGKYTTYRLIAKDAVDAAVGVAGHEAPASCTDQVPLLGSEGYLTRWNQREQLAEQHGISVAQVEHLLHRYGGLVDEVFAVMNSDRSLAEPLPGAAEYLAAEATYAVSHEGARHLEDVLLRRTRIGIETVHRGTETAEAVAKIVGPLLGWDDDQRERELEDYRRQVSLERAAELAPDDDAANRLVADAPALLPAP